MKKLVLTIIIIWVKIAYPYGARPEHVAADSIWLMSLQDKYQVIDSVFANVSWAFYTTGVWPDIPDKYYSLMNEFVLSRYSLKKYDRIQGEFGSPEINRVARQMYIRLHRGRNNYFPDTHGLGPSLARIFINHRPVFEDETRSNNFLLKILKNEPDRERREKAWYALNEIGSLIAPGLKELVRERNNVAREIGFENYYELQLLAMGMNEENLFDILATLDSVSYEPYMSILDRMKLNFKLDSIEPWDLNSLSNNIPDLDRYFPVDSLMNILNRTMDGLGFAIDGIGINFDLEPRPGKYQHAVCFPVDIPDDIRILANIDNGLASYEIMFHEVGHALHFAHIAQTHYILRTSPAGCFAEAMAEINRMMLEQPEWLTEYAGIPDSLLRAVFFGLKESAIINLRYALARVYFERELYRTEAENPNGLYWDFIAKFTMCNPHSDSEAWAAVPHFTGNPVYIHNYILAELIAAQAIDYLKKTNGSIIDNKSTAEFLINNFYKPGASKDWFELIEEATGEPLNSKYYIEYILGR